MKTITIISYRHEKVERERKITNVVHDIPVWVFPTKINDNVNDCPVCRYEMKKEISHGNYYKTCSAIELDGIQVKSIHTQCYEQIKDI